MTNYGRKQKVLMQFMTEGIEKEEGAPKNLGFPQRGFYKEGQPLWDAF